MTKPIFPAIFFWQVLSSILDDIDGCSRKWQGLTFNPSKSAWSQPSRTSVRPRLGVIGVIGVFGQEPLFPPVCSGRGSPEVLGQSPNEWRGGGHWRTPGAGAFYLTSSFASPLVSLWLTIWYNLPTFTVSDVHHLHTSEFRQAARNIQACGVANVEKLLLKTYDW